MGRIVRAKDVVWLILFAALVAVSPFKTPIVIGLLLCLGLFQLAEPRVAVFATTQGRVAAILLKLVICYLVIAYTNGINSDYLVILLLPVISAATSLSGLGTAAVITIACALYLSMLAFVGAPISGLTAQEVSYLGLRVIFLPVVGFLAFELAEENREAVRRHEAAVAELASANKSLQEAEDAVRRSDRLAALGQLTAGLAHELRNPLGTMKASAEMLLKQASSGDEVLQELAGFISTEVDRTNSLITRFLDFARPLRLRLDKEDPHKVLDAAVEELGRHNPPYNVAIYKNYSPDVRPLPIDGELMQRVFYNLLVNAAQASPAGAAITIKTRQMDKMVEVSIIDRGSGIDPEHLESIFNPFFTTKSSGVGLGLAIVSKIVDEHGGKITADSEKGTGSVFRVYLPDTA